jgi:hypothetical protein
MPATRNGRRHKASQLGGRWPSSMQQAQESTGGITEEVLQSLRSLVRAKPEQAALWCLGIGFVLGWKLKPW